MTGELYGKKEAFMLYALIRSYNCDRLLLYISESDYL